MLFILWKNLPRRMSRVAHCFTAFFNGIMRTITIVILISVKWKANLTGQTLATLSCVSLEYAAWVFKEQTRGKGRVCCGEIVLLQCPRDDYTAKLRMISLLSVSFKWTGIDRIKITGARQKRREKIERREDHMAGMVQFAAIIGARWAIVKIVCSGVTSAVFCVA